MYLTGVGRALADVSSMITVDNAQCEVRNLPPNVVELRMTIRKVFQHEKN